MIKRICLLPMQAQALLYRESEKIKKQISGVGCKNLFLKDKEEHYFLVLIDDYKKAKVLKIGGKK